MNAIISSTLLLLLTSLSLQASTISSQSQYQGKVGSSNVRSTLQYHYDDTVSGWYISLKTGKKYLLRGHNKVQGKLYLTEYTLGNNGDWYATSDVFLTQNQS